VTVRQVLLDRCQHTLTSQPADRPGTSGWRVLGLLIPPSMRLVDPEFDPHAFWHGGFETDPGGLPGQDVADTAQRPPVLIPVT
jgi:hypothetical protein